MNLEELLKEYKEITQLMINKVTNGEDISPLVTSRQRLLEKINSLSFNKEEIKRLIEENDINQLNNKLENLMKDNMLEIKKEIKKVKQSREAYKKYSDFNGNAVIFSTKR